MAHTDMGYGRRGFYLSAHTGASLAEGCSEGVNSPPPACPTLTATAQDASGEALEVWHVLELAAGDLPVGGAPTASATFS